MFHVPEQHRITRGSPSLSSDRSFGNNGAFQLQATCGARRRLVIIASDGEGWEHVSVHAIQGTRSRTPTWDEMCLVKGLFWGREDVVMQLHPRESEYVNQHPDTLHLWRPIGEVIPTPSSTLVGDTFRKREGGDRDVTEHDEPGRSEAAPGGVASEAPGIVALRTALETLKQEAAAGSSRELSLAITNCEQALMWRCQAP